MRQVLEAQVLEAQERLANEFRERFFAAGATGFDVWGNGAKIGVEARFGSLVGPVWGPSVRYARRNGLFGIFGPLVPFRTIESVEAELRTECEAYLARLAAGHKPRFRPE